MVGPQSTIVRNQRVVDDSADEILTPDAVWPSDHKAVLANFTVCGGGCTTPEPEQPTVTLASASVAAGDAITISGAGFPAATALRIELRSTPVPLGAVTTDATGGFRVTVTVPAATKPGTHSIVLIDPDGVETTAAIAVTAAPGGTPPGGGTPGGGTPGGAPGGAPADGSGNAGSGPGTTSNGDLAATGADSVPFLLAGVLLLAVGAGLGIARRRWRLG